MGALELTQAFCLCVLNILIIIQEVFMGDLKKEGMNNDSKNKTRFCEAVEKAREERALQNVKVLLGFFREKADMKVKVYSSSNCEDILTTNSKITKKSDHEIIFSVQDSDKKGFITLTGRECLNTTDSELILEMEDEKIFFSHGVRTYFERAE